MNVEIGILSSSIFFVGIQIQEMFKITKILSYRSHEVFKAWKMRLSLTETQTHTIHGHGIFIYIYLKNP